LGNRNWSSLHPGTEFDEAKRKEIYAETQRLQEYTCIHLVAPLSLAAVRDRVQGKILCSRLAQGQRFGISELKVTE